MTVYLVAILLTAIISSVGSGQRSYTITENGRKIYYWSNLYTIAILIVWCFVFAFRGLSVGSDTSGYYAVYCRIFSENMSYSNFITYERDVFFATLTFFCAKFFQGNWIWFQVVVAILTYLPIISVVKKNSNDVTTSLLLFIFTLQFYSGFNGMRQGIAMSFVVYAYFNYLLEKKYLKFAILILVAFSVHSSVILVVPFLLFSLCGFSSKIVRWSAAAIVVLYLFMWQIWPYIIQFFTAIGQEKMANDYAETGTGHGSGLLRVIVAMLPFVLGFFYKNILREKYKNIDVELAMVLYSALFMLLSMRYWIFARVSSYFCGSLVIFIPKLIDIFTDRCIGKVFILILYFSYMVALLLHGDGAYYPYTFFN